MMCVFVDGVRFHRQHALLWTMCFFMNSALFLRWRILSPKTHFVTDVCFFKDNALGYRCRFFMDSMLCHGHCALSRNMLLFTDIAFL